MAFCETPAPGPIGSRASTTAGFESSHAKESQLPALVSDKLLWAHYPPREVASDYFDSAKRKGVARNVYHATGLLGEIQDAQARSSAQHVAVDGWLDRKQRERHALANTFANDPQWKGLLNELAYWKHVAHKTDAAPQQAQAQAAIKEIYATFAERNHALEQADVAVRADMAGALVALTRGGGPRSERDAYVPPTAGPPPPQQQPTMGGLAAAMFGRAEDELPKAPPKVELDLRGTPRLTRNNNAPGAFKFKLNINDQPTHQQRFEWFAENGADVGDQGRAEAVAPPRPYEIQVPDWFRQIETDGRVACQIPTVEGRFKAFCNSLHRLEADMRHEKENERKEEEKKTEREKEVERLMKKSKKKAKPKAIEQAVAEAYKGAGAAWDKHFHEPNAGWHLPIRQKRGGWWKCRAGADATEAERRCRLCHRVDNKPSPEQQGQPPRPPPPPPPGRGKAKEVYNAFMAMIEQAMSKVSARDRAVMEYEDEQRQRRRQDDDEQLQRQRQDDDEPEGIRMRRSTWDLVELADDERMRVHLQSLVPEQE